MSHEYDGSVAGLYALSALAKIRLLMSPRTMADTPPNVTGTERKTVSATARGSLMSAPTMA